MEAVRKKEEGSLTTKNKWHLKSREEKGQITKMEVQPTRDNG